MLLNISQIGQIALPVRDVDRSEAFYEQALGLRKLFRFGDLSFFDCAGVRLLIDKASDPANFKPQGCIYFRCADIALAVAELEKRGVEFLATERVHSSERGALTKPLPGGMMFELVKSQPRNGGTP